MEERLQKLTHGMALLISLALAAVYYFSMYDGGESREQQIQNINSEITRAQTDIERMNKAIKDAQVYRDLSAKLGDELNLVVSALPAEYNTVELMKVLSTEAKGSGLSILSLNGQSSTASTSDKKDIFYEPVVVSAAFEGTFNQVVQFLSNLTKVNRIILLKQVQLNVKGQVNSTTISPILTLNATFEAYRYLQVAKSGGK
jgi:Tfp pilus assembly protein PilO